MSRYSSLNEMPERPACKEARTSSLPLPMHETMPIPVTATRRMKPSFPKPQVSALSVRPLVGGEGGNRNFNLDCGPGNVLVGVMEKHGSWLDALGVICARVNPQTGALENEFTRGTVGGQGGNANEVKCGFEHVVQGISFSAGQFINKGTLGCERWNRSDKAPRAPRVLSCSENALGHCRPFGSFSGGSFNGPFTCPEGKVGKAFRGKHGIYIDSLRFVCDDWDK